jgi:hypothetical protein
MRYRIRQQPLFLQSIFIMQGPFHTCQMSASMEIETITQAEPLVVSYTLFVVKQQNSLELLQKISTTINVQLTFEDHLLPFVPFKGFDEIKHHSKVFLNGIILSDSEKSLEFATGLGEGVARGRPILVGGIAKL